MTFLKNLPGRLLNGGACLILCLLSALVVLLLEFAPKLAYEAIKESKPASTCTLKDYDSRGEQVYLKLDCGGVEARLSDAKVITTYLKHPGTLICSVKVSGDAQCQPRP